MTRTEEKHRLIMEFGLLVSDLKKLVEGATDISIPFAEADFERDFGKFMMQVHLFCIIDGRQLQFERNKINDAAICLKRMFARLRAEPENIDHIRMQFETHVHHTLQTIDDVPCVEPGGIMPNESPFQTYVQLYSSCCIALQRVDLFDPWLDEQTFYRYCFAIRPTTAITITTDRDGLRKDANRRNRIIAVSELLAIERPANYRFLVHPSLHDRHLRTDDAICHLGGSVKDAGIIDPYTIAVLPSASHADLDKWIGEADEWFGPTVTTHRKS